MNWKKLYSNRRFGKTSSRQFGEGRGEYIRDYDRVIFSDPFRKLQNKTQVFPLPGAVFVHNRLTHSLEVASVGRSLGKIVGERLAEKYKDDFGKSDIDFYENGLSDVIQTACLAHDIGNPPFGHFGEEAIREFFTGFFEKYGHFNLSENRIKDFTRFEGNANAFRILTTLFSQDGLKLTYTTPASIVKYPCSSEKGFNKAKISTKKSGFMDFERETFAEIARELEIPGEKDCYSRHPFVYLVEAADDICYRIIDLEDAFKLEVVQYREVEELFMPIFKGSDVEAYLIDKLSSLEENHRKVSLLRAFLINHLTQLCTDVFLQNEENLLNGNLNHSLIDLLDEDIKLRLKKVDRFSVERIYNHHTVIEKELSGHTVLSSLLEDFTGIVTQPESEKSKKLTKFIPRVSSSEDIYQKLLVIIDFISQMTDDYALELYRKTKGIY